MSADGPRVLVVTPDYPPATGGIQLLIRHVVEGFDPGNVRVITLGYPGDREFDATRPERIVRVGHKGGRIHRASVAALNARALAAAAAWRPAVVISGHVTAAPATLAIAKLSRAVAVQYVYADEFRTRPGLCSRAVRGADAVVTISDYTTELALAAGASEELITLITPGVDATPNAGGERASRPTILTVARLVEHKGHETVVRALPAIRRRVPAVEWVVIGDGPMRAELELLADDLDVRECITFLGALSDRERDGWLSRAHVFTMPSRLPPGGIGGEGFGIVFLEAGAWGLPVVGPDVGGPRDAIVPGETGFAIDPLDHEALAEAISTLLLDPDLASRFGEAGARNAREQTWARHTDSLRELIGSILAGRASG